MLTNQQILDAARESFGEDYQFMPDDPFIDFAHKMYAASLLAGAERCRELRMNDGDGQHVSWYVGFDMCDANLREMAKEIE